MKENSKMSSESLVVHAGVDKNEHRAVVPPIYQTSTFAFDSAEQGAALFSGEREGYIYSRMGNPTVRGLRSVSRRWKAVMTGWPAAAVWLPSTRRSRCC